MKKDISPYPYFGKKTKIAAKVWQYFGKVNFYFEPFFGDGAVYLHGAERGYFRNAVINDLDSYVANFWRAVKASPQEVAAFADEMTSHVELHSRRRWLQSNGESLTARMQADPEFYDAKAAGWWVWCASNWIGSGMTSEEKRRENQRPHISDDLGINQKRPNFNIRKGANAQIPNLSGGRGIRSRIPQLSGNSECSAPTGDDAALAPAISFLPHVYGWFARLAEIMRSTRTLCGDWSRMKHFITYTAQHDCAAIFFDPPYGVSDRTECYDHDDLTGELAVGITEFSATVDNCAKIIIAGYDGETAYDALIARGWKKIAWRASGGYGNQSGNANRNRERLWCSPKCNLDAGLFDG